MSKKVKKRSSSAYLRVLWAFVAVVCVFMLSILFIETQDEMSEIPAKDAPYRQSSLSTDERVNDLLARMTLREKVAQMALVEKNSVHDVNDITKFALGGMLSGFGGKPENNSLEGWQEMTKTFREASQKTRLGIPVLYGVDAIHGHTNMDTATIFPHTMALGATGNAELVTQVAKATAEELTATGVYWSFSPTLDMPEDIRWGRTYETFSDDPTLVGTLGAAYIEGLQTSPMSSTSLFVLGTPKHYIGAGGMVWGSSSNKNFHIDQGTTPASETLLREVHLPPFQEAVKNGAMSIMVGLNSWGDTKLSAHSYLIQDVLKGELGFKGFTVSDWYGVYEIPGGDYKAAVTAINAGIDMVMLPFDYETFIKNVTLAVKRGEISEERIDDAVARILRAKFSLGLFDAPRNGGVENGMVGTEEHRELARKAVAQSLVLLKNDSSVLPISKNIKHIRVAGSSADNVGRQSGAWTLEWQGVDGNWLPHTTSILAGIREQVGSGTVIEYEMSANFSTGTERADIGIAIVGEAPYAEGWGDSEEPRLSASDIETIKKLKVVSKKVVVVLVSGRPLIITNELPSWDALVMAWLPGGEGSGIADVLFGDVQFQGKLPLPWPSDVSQLPISRGRTHDGTAPLFPRYFGLK